MSSGGQILGGIAGGIVGFFTPVGPWLGAQIGMGIGGYLDPPKGPTVNGPTLDDLTVQTSTYGATVPRIYGTVSVVGNVFWLENNQLKPTVTKKKSGGKGGAKTTTRTTTYSATFAVALCKGPIVGIRRLWIRTDLVYDAGSSDPNTIAASNQSAAGWTLYTGTDTQGADPRMQATLGVANTPAWRGLAYLVFEDLQLEKYGNSLLGAQIKAEVVGDGVIGGVATVDTFALPSTSYHRGPRWNGSEWFGLVNYTPSKLVSSTDMTSWAEYPLPTPYQWSDVVFDSGQYVACGASVPSVATGCMAYSFDKINWTMFWFVSIGPWNWQWIISGNGGFLVVEGKQGAGIYSSNGVRTFFSANLGVDYDYGWLALNVNCEFSQPCYNGAVFVVGGQKGASPALFTSVTGIGAWNEETLPAGVSHIYGVCAFGSSLMVAGYDQGTNTGKVSISTNSGVTWSAWVNLPASVGSSGWRNPSHNGSEFFIYEAGTDQWATSPDGVSWVAHSLPGSAAPYQADPTQKAWNGSAWGAFCDTPGRAMLFTPGSVGITPNLVMLGSIVSAECLQSGLLTAGDIDVSALTASVRGYRIGSIGTLRSALEPLQAGWPFDVVQRGYKLAFKPRGGASVATIAAGDLDARGADQDAGVQITRSREIDSQLPRRLTVRYLDSAREYDAGSQYAERLAVATIRETVVDLPIVFDAGEAAGKAEVLLYAAWLSRLQVSFNLPASYLHLEPADVVTLPTPDGSITVRLTQVNYTSDNRVECRAMLEHPAVYTPVALGVEASTTGATTISPLGPSIYALLDIPRLSSAQDGVGFPVAMCGDDPTWPGGVLMRSADAGATYDEPLDFATPGATIGAATTTIGAVDSRLIDAASRLTVTLTSGSLSDVSELSMLGGANHFAYGAAGRWEIIAARTCTLQSGSTYILSNMLRGRFGSEWAMGLHAGGDTVVLLDSSDLQMLTQSNADIGASRLYRAITSGRDFSTDSDRAMTYAAVNLKPLSPVYLNGSRHPGTADWSLEWIRRTRVGGEWRDGVDAELGEASEAYDIEVYADGSYTAIKRTITAVIPSCAYSSADQVSDFGSNQGTLYIRVYQRSATVGRGYPLTTSITR